MSVSGCRRGIWRGLSSTRSREMDLEAFYAAYRVDGRSRPPYDPAMMVALLLYAYARGIRSSRVIERACEEDVAFRVLAAQQRPDHATLARFVERHQDAIAGLFGEVLTLCARSGLAQGRRDRGRRHEGAGERVAQREPRLRAARARDRRGGQGGRRGRGRALRRGARRRAAAGVRDRAGSPRVAARGQAAPGGRARGEPAAGAAQPPEAPQGGQAPPGGGALDRGARQPGLRGLPGARADEGRAALRPATGPLPAAGHAGRSRQRHRSRLTRRQGPARVSCRATTRRPSPTSTRSSWPPRSRPSAPTSGTSSRCSTPPNASSRPPASTTRPRCCWPTPATGTASRCNASSTAASRC